MLTTDQDYVMAAHLLHHALIGGAPTEALMWLAASSYLYAHEQWLTDRQKWHKNMLAMSLVVEGLQERFNEEQGVLNAPTRP